VHPLHFSTKDLINVNDTWKIISGIGILIFVFLLLDKSSMTTKILNSIGKSAVDLISILQGN
jgi:hypothetical protein